MIYTATIQRNFLPFFPSPLPGLVSAEGYPAGFSIGSEAGSEALTAASETVPIGSGTIFAGTSSYSGACL